MVGKIRDGHKVTFEGDYFLQGFEIVPPSGNYQSYGDYQLGTKDGRSMNFTGWIESGADKLVRNKLYHFYFSYDSRYKNAKPKIIGIDIIKGDTLDINL